MSEETISEDDPGVQAVEAALKTLSEFFDSVHIVATVKCHDDSGGFTEKISRGNGNFSARFGSLREAVIKLEEDMRESRRNRKKDDEETI